MFPWFNRQGAPGRLTKEEFEANKDRYLQNCLRHDTFLYVQKSVLFGIFLRFPRGQLPKPAQLASNKVNAELVMQR